MNTEQERAELLPCPFCGSRNVAQRFTREASFEALSFVECYDCGARGSGVSGQGGEAIEEWNRRAALQSQDRADAERLDWLEDQAQTSRTGVSIDYVYDAQDGYVNEKGYRFMRHRFIGPLGKTAREAIDHARRIEGDGE